MQVSKRRQQENMEQNLIQVEECLIQAGEDQEEWCTQHLRAEESNALFEQSSHIFLQLLGNPITQQHMGKLNEGCVKADKAEKAAS